MAVVDLFSKQQLSMLELRETWLVRWYPKNYRRLPQKSNISIQWQNKTAKHLQDMALACVEDMNNIGQIELDFSLSSLKAVEAIITPSWRQVLINQSDPLDQGNKFLIILIELGAYIGKTLENNYDCHWIYRAPYFESSLIYNGKEIWIFDEIQRAFTENIDDALSTKVSALFEEACEQR